MPRKTTKPEPHLEQTALSLPAAASKPAPPKPAPKPDIPAAPVAFPPPPETAWKWPASTETRDLIVSFSLQDEADNSHKQAKAQQQKERVESEKANAVKEYNALISAQEDVLSKIASLVTAGGERRPITCTWVFEASGRDDTGAWVENPEFKTLVRNDTGEVVTSTRITAADRQGNLELSGDEQPDDEYEVILLGGGYRVELLDPVPAGRTPFQLVEISSGTAGDIAGADNRHAALKAAVRIVEETLAEANGDTPSGPIITKGEFSFDDDEDTDLMADIAEDGRAARRAGKGRNTCPYDAGTLSRQTWKEGWDEADSHELQPLKTT